MIDQIKRLRAKTEQLKGRKQKTEMDIESFNKEKMDVERELINTEQAQAIIQKVAQKTQQELEYHISDLVSTALSAIFDEPYEFKLYFVIRRGTTEAVFKFARNGEEVDPMVASGGGAVDVAAFALRIALWSLKQKRSRNTIVLDEPFRFLSRELQPKASSMLKLLSEKLGIQFIIVTHNNDLVEAADKVFHVKQRRGKSVVEVVK